MFRTLFALIATVILLSACSTPQLTTQQPQPPPGIPKGPMAERFKNLTQGPAMRVRGGELVSGRIMVDGREPLAGGRVSFFAEKIGPPSNYGNLRRIPEVVSFVNEDGTFSLQVPPGRYYMGAMSRDMSKGPGPPRPGERTFSAMDSNNNLLIIDIKEKMETKLGSVTVRHRDHSNDLQDIFTLTGTVMDAAGQPLEGAVLLVKINPNLQRPNFISEKTGKDGRFKFLLPAGRPYFLLAKDTLSAGKPSAGRRVGAYTGSDPNTNVLPKPVPITGKPGEIINDIKIVLNELPDPEKQKAKFRGRPMVQSPDAPPSSP